MKIKRHNAEKIDIVLKHYCSQISKYSADVSKVAELRAVKTLRDGFVQALEALGVDGLCVNQTGVEFDVDQAAIDETDNVTQKFKIRKFSDKRIPDRESTPICIRFSDDERAAIKSVADKNDVKSSDVVRSALIFAGVIQEFEIFESPDLPA